MQESDQWQTPQDLFEELDSEFGFDIDLCATHKNSNGPTFPSCLVIMDRRKLSGIN